MDGGRRLARRERAHRWPLLFVGSSTSLSNRAHMHALARRVVAAGALLTLAAPAAFAQIPASEYAARRDSLAARVGDGVVVAFGGRTPTTDFGPFYQLAAFHYLTNFDEPDAAF